MYKTKVKSYFFLNVLKLIVFCTVCIIYLNGLSFFLSTESTECHFIRKIAFMQISSLVAYMLLAVVEG